MSERVPQKVSDSKTKNIDNQDSIHRAIVRYRLRGTDPKQDSIHRAIRRHYLNNK